MPETKGTRGKLTGRLDFQSPKMCHTFKEAEEREIKTKKQQGNKDRGETGSGDASSMRRGNRAEPAAGCPPTSSLPPGRRPPRGAQACSPSLRSQLQEKENTLHRRHGTEGLLALRTRAIDVPEAWFCPERK